MKKMGRHCVFFDFVALCLFAAVLNYSMSEHFKNTLNEVQAHHADQEYIPVSFENPLDNVHTESALSETNKLPTPSLKKPFSSLSVHSKIAHSLLESKTTDYIGRVVVSSIQPRIFDLLFPFHYYS
jgi:hypothetical protein